MSYRLTELADTTARKPGRVGPKDSSTRGGQTDRGRGAALPGEVPAEAERVSLYAANTPAAFWRIVDNPALSEAAWATAVQAAAYLLPPSVARHSGDIGALLAWTLGEQQFGTHHRQLNWQKRLYYELKPWLPRPLTRGLRRVYGGMTGRTFTLNWPIEDRYVRFQYEVVRRLLQETNLDHMQYIHFWPHNHRFALALTHDIETADGQANVERVADLEERLGFRSSFNFVPERYQVDRGLMERLRTRGFEIGLHGLKHDGRLFRSFTEFARRAIRINHYFKLFGSVGFRSPLTHREPLWMQALDMEYDSSFFDVDPYEPQPGGCMSIWPFFVGRFVELPYTLAQDYTLSAVLRETTPRIWLDKVDFIEAHCGLALLNSHPDYLRERNRWRVYEEFLRAMESRGGYWQALPHEIARWWRDRSQLPAESLPGVTESEIPGPFINFSQAPATGKTQ